MAAKTESPPAHRDAGVRSFCSLLKQSASPLRCYSITPAPGERAARQGLWG